MVRVSREGFAVGARRAGAIVVFGVIPVAIVVAVLGSTLALRTFQYDFHGALYNGAHAILHGRDPYRVRFLAHLAAIRQSGSIPETVFAVPVYPAPALVGAIPLAVLPVKLAGALYALLSLAAMIAGLRLLGVTDWRCYGAAFLTWPLIHSLRLGQVNELLVLGLALIWRWRDRVISPALATAAVVGSILFLWPIGVFLIATRRVRTVVLAAAIVIAATLAAWSLIGFADLTSYPSMLNNLASIEGPSSVSLVSAGLGLGASRALSEAIAIAITLVILALAWHFAHKPDGERRAFGLAIMAALTSSPLVWPHYFTLVFVPIALLAPTISPLWLVPLLAYAAPIAQTNGDLWKALPYIATELIIVVALCRWHYAGGERWLPAPGSEVAVRGELAEAPGQGFS